MNARIAEYPEIHDSTLLLVDDEPVNIKLVQKMLLQAGYSNILSTQYPEQVKDLFLNHEIDLILLDLNMPKISGFEILKQLRSLKELVPPILVLTAQQSREARCAALECGARDFVSKPFDRLELLARVRNLLEVHLFQKSIKFQNQILEHTVMERTQELRSTQLEIVRRLGRAAEFRDNETGYHIIRMSQISEIIAREVGMQEPDRDLLLNASPMHDIGKIGIPDSILLKPGKLDKTEWKVMQTHTTIGGDILSGDDCEVLAMAREIALTHHERWDGKGYPNALSQDEIPLVGRIVAVADVFDALTSDRSYKKAWGLEESLDYMKDNSGKHFDPNLVSVFFDNLSEIQQVRERYRED